MVYVKYSFQERPMKILTTLPQIYQVSRIARESHASQRHLTLSLLY